MLTFACPKCSARVPLWPGLRARFSRQGRRGKRQCPSCGAWLELRNGYLLSLAYGLMLGLFISAFRFVPWVSGLVWSDRLLVLLVLAVVLGFTALPLMLLRFGRWQVLADGYRDSPEVTRWSRLMNASAWIAFVALAVIPVTIYIEVRQLLSRLPAPPTPEGMDALVHRVELTIGVTFGAGLAVGLAALGVSIRAAVRRQRARDAEQQDAW
jgi:hypothetical protein